MVFKAMFKVYVVGYADSYEEAKQMIVDKYGEFDPNFAYIEILDR